MATLGGVCVDSSLLRLESRRHNGTALSRSIEILQRHNRGIEAGKLGLLGVVFWEGDGNRRVVENVARRNICVEFL